MKLHRDQCYPVAEAFYHMLGGKEAGWTPQVTHMPDGQTHWYLRHKSGFILDPTATQFVDMPYEDGRGCGFLTKCASRRAKMIIDTLTG